VPADVLSGVSPTELEVVATGANEIFDSPDAVWNGTSVTIQSMTRAWRTIQAGNVPPRVDARMSIALDRLVDAVASRDAALARHAALEVAQSSLDLQLRYRRPAEIDRARFELWARRLLLDAGAEDAAGVRGDLATLEWIRDRFVNEIDTIDVTRIDRHLLELRTKVGDDDLRGASAEATVLRDTLARLGSTS